MDGLGAGGVEETEAWGVVESAVGGLALVSHAHRPNPIHAAKSKLKIGWFMNVCSFGPTKKGRPSLQEPHPKAGPGTPEMKEEGAAREAEVELGAWKGSKRRERVDHSREDRAAPRIANRYRRRRVYNSTRCIRPDPDEVFHRYHRRPCLCKAAGEKQDRHAPRAARG